MKCVSVLRSALVCAGILTCSGQSLADTHIRPVAILRTVGKVSGAGELIKNSGGTCALEFEKGGSAPSVALDFGSGGAGGYAVFHVTALRGTPVVRLAYACHPEGLTPTGDFSRASRAAYMGLAVELPVLPANVNRHEFYTIRRTGTFIAPLIQGLARYVLVQLDTPESSVSIDSVCFANSEVFNDVPPIGSFRCSDSRWNQLWAASVRTLEVASFPNADAWKTVDGWLLPRKLEKGSEIGLTRADVEPADGTVETCFELRTNPHFPDRPFGLLCRASADGREGILITFSQANQLLSLFVCRDGRNQLIHTTGLRQELLDGIPYVLSAVFQGSTLTLTLNGQRIDQASLPPCAGGRLGFYTAKEAWPLYDYIRVRDARGKIVFEDGFENGLAAWDFARTRPFIADGAKRDRLIWSGDLWWAERNAFYAWPNDRFMRGSIELLAFNQTPEGYVQACPYAETSVPPATGDYGSFQSDEFAAWLIPVAADYLLYTGDTQTLRSLWGPVTKLLAYLERNCTPDGLFRQRYETSKFAYSPGLGFGITESRAYMNILLWACWRDAAAIADSLAETAAAVRYRAKARALQERINALLWDDVHGFYREAVGNDSFAMEGNALALAMRFATPERARRIVNQGKVKLLYDKFLSLAIRGNFEYGFTAEALDALIHFPKWFTLVSPAWEGLSLTSECLNLIRTGAGDEAHPDTAIAGLFSAYILGIVPTRPGFARFSFKPQMLKDRLTWAEGRVPTPHGLIEVSWHLEGETLKTHLVVPPDTAAEFNGRVLGPGTYDE